MLTWQASYICNVKPFGHRKEKINPFKQLKACLTVEVPVPCHVFFYCYWKKKNQEESIITVESKGLAPLLSCTFEDVLKIDDQITPGSEKIPFNPTTVTTKTFDHKNEVCPLSSSPWMMVWNIESEAWYLNINFLDGHASLYRLSVSFVIREWFDSLHAHLYLRLTQPLGFEFLYKVFSCMFLYIKQNFD